MQFVTRIFGYGAPRETLNNLLVAARVVIAQMTFAAIFFWPSVTPEREIAKCAQRRTHASGPADPTRDPRDAEEPSARGCLEGMEKERPRHHGRDPANTLHQVRAAWR
jgi:hypothetical protein